MHINTNAITAPLVVFFGPRGAGKTTVLRRMRHYLFEQGHSLEINTSFRSDIAYQETIHDFNNVFGDWGAIAPRTQGCSLIDVGVGRGTSFHILEAQGEYFYSLVNPTQQMSVPLAKILASNKQQTIWVLFFEDNMFFPVYGYPTTPNKSPQTHQANYIKQIGNVLGLFIKPTDKIILLYNKVDKMNAFYHGKLVEEQIYPKFESNFGFVRHKIPRQIEPVFVPFSSGLFLDNESQLVKGEDIFPAKLIDEILK